MTSFSGIIDTFLNGKDPQCVSLIVCILVLAYWIITGLLVKKRPKYLWIPATLLLATSTLFYFYAYDLAGAKSFLSRLFMSFTTALDLFLFRMNSTYGNLYHYFYIDSTVSDYDAVVIANRLIILVGLYICSIWTTSILAMHFFARRMVSKFQLAWYTLFHKNRKNVFLFLGASPEAVALAQTLGKDASIVFVDLPAREVLPDKVSFLQFFQGLRANTDLSESLRHHKTLSKALILKARKPLARCTGSNLFKDLGLKKLERLANWENTRIFILSPSYQENLTALQKLEAYPAEIYCNARRNSMSVQMEMAREGHIHIIDSSYLATRALKARKEFYPIGLMKIAKDKHGQPLGYVQSAFNALLCGFSESGQGMLSFLYEFGAFPDKDKQPNRFWCEAIDTRMDRIAGEYKMEHPGLVPERVGFRKCTVGSEEFWDLIKERIQDLNYVYVSIGEDEVNMNCALDMLEFAFRNRSSMDNFLIVVKLDHEALYHSVIQFYNQNCGAGKTVLRTIGDIESTWTWDNISGASYIQEARKYYAAYARATSDNPDWDKRNQDVLDKDNSALSNILELKRKTSQDFANCYHVHVKEQLCPERLWKDPSIAANIPHPDDVVDGKHFTGDDPQAESVLDYLAVGEHLRWNASHEAAGYRLGETKSEDKKTHPAIRPYEEISERLKHYDWIVVKTTLEILRNSEKND